MFFEDREILIEGESPDGRWRLYIYAPGETEGDASHFAEFERSDESRAHGIPFGPADSKDEISVDWSLAGNICALYLNGECCALYKWGEGFTRPRGFFRNGDEAPFSEQEIKEICG